MESSIVGEKPKLEEDICPPFISRLSRSVTIPIRERIPRRLSDCVLLFPEIGEQLQHSDDFLIERVNDTLIHEEVFIGPKFTLNGRTVETALIFWRRSPQGRIAIVEFSYRHKVGKRQISRLDGLSFFRLFEAVQLMDWVRAKPITKTNYLYGTTRKEC